MHTAVTPQQNLFLASLPPEVQQRLFSHLELIELPPGNVLQGSGNILQHVYFPTDALVSLLYVMENGASAEILLAGNDGMIGVEMFMGGESSQHLAIVQMTGHAFRLARHPIKAEFDRHGELMNITLRYTQALMTQMAQTAACNRHHSLDQRLCRWLLLSLDRLPDDSLNITQELIAKLLGVRREGVTDAAGRLQKLGVIAYRRGRIHLLDRAALEHLSCECYAVVKKEIRRLLPHLYGSPWSH